MQNGRARRGRKMSEISTTPISAHGEERRGETAASELSTGRALNGQEDNFVSGQTALDRDRKSGQKMKKYTKRRRVRVGKEAGRRGDDYRRNRWKCFLDASAQDR